MLIARALVALLAGALAVTAATAAGPQAKDARYIYYLHGKIEDSGPRGVSPRFGARPLPEWVRPTVAWARG